MIDSEDHIDDLFRKAREHYPLKTGDGDWDRVLNELKKETGETAISASKTQGKDNRRLLWLLLLLLPLGWMINTKFTGNLDSFKLNKMREGQGIATDNSLHKTNAMDNKIIVSRKTTNRVSGSTITNNNIRFSKSSITEANNKVPFNYSNATAINKELTLTLPLKGKVSSMQIYKPSLERENDYRIAKENSSLLTDTSLAKNKTVSKKTSKIKRGLYVGVLAGPDISTIKLQQVKNAGYSLGILIGYRLNKRFSLETNLLWDKKNYYTDGKYVNKQDLSIPSSVSVINLNGYCHMYELDLTGRYDFTPYKRQHFFARGGLASYFMKKQDYSYLATWSNGTLYSRSVDYENATNNLFSVLHISAGYEYKVGKVSIRIEPYLNIPTAGLGKGKLPVTSMSLYMGISVPLH
jgi:hypothetical protein